MVESMQRIYGFDQIGPNGRDGLRFTWIRNQSKQYIESASFKIHRVGCLDDICGYTTSVSSGCVLSEWGMQCRFCRTGNSLKYFGGLSAKEIAIQNIFMVLVDIEEEKRLGGKVKQREFAYMGQGEPGLNYTNVRKAIEITNYAMRKLGQVVHRHIFSTSGILPAIHQFELDLNNYFTEQVSFHYSLHCASDRSYIMPINQIYPYQEVLKELPTIRSLSCSLPCIGILLFNDFIPKGKESSFTSTTKTITEILDELDPTVCRVSFCEFNPHSSLGSSGVYPEKLALQALAIAESRGFDCKAFHSFGKKELAACGLLASKEPDHLVPGHMIELYEQAKDLIEQVYDN